MKKTFMLSEIQSVAREVLEATQPRRKTCAAVIALSGDLGAGKTTLTQAIARELGVKENLVSPTFVIMKNYVLPLYKGEMSSTTEGVYRKLIHIDAYRLNSKTELEKLGWQEIVSDKNNLILLEWPERVEGLLGEEILKVTLAHKEENLRQIEIA